MLLAKKGRKYPKIKVLVVHPTKEIRDRVESYISETFGCKVTTTTNYDRALTKLQDAAVAGGPAAKFHIVVTAYDIAAPSTGQHNQGPALVQAIRSNPLIQKISVILETAGNKVKDIDADAFFPSLEKMEGLA